MNKEDMNIKIANRVIIIINNKFVTSRHIYSHVFLTFGPNHGGTTNKENIYIIF